MSLVQKSLTMYSLLEWMNINYQLNYERANTIHRSNKIDKHGSVGTDDYPKGKERVS